MKILNLNLKESKITWFTKTLNLNLHRHKTS
jgi:hypothetical protein